MIFSFNSKQLKKVAALLYLSTIQTWLNFNYPAFVKLGSPLNFIASTFVSIICIFVYLYIFLYGKNFISKIVNLKFLDDFPDSMFFKNIFIVGMLIIFHTIYFYMWQTHYNISNVWPIICYLHCILTFLLIYIVHKKIVE